MKIETKHYVKLTIKNGQDIRDWNDLHDQMVEFGYLITFNREIAVINIPCNSDNIRSFEWITYEEELPDNLLTLAREIYWSME